MIRAVPQGEDNPQFEEVFACFKEYYGKHCNDKTRAYDGIMEMLAQLKNRGYAVAIVSNKIDSAVKELQKRYFDELISVAIGEREGVSRKPAPDTVLTALQELGRKVDEAVYVGDSDVDIMTACNARMDAILVDWGFRGRKFLLEHGAECVVDKPCEILEEVTRG